MNKMEETEGREQEFTTRSGDPFQSAAEKMRTGETLSETEKLAHEKQMAAERALADIVVNREAEVNKKKMAMNAFSSPGTGLSGRLNPKKDQVSV